MNTIRFEHVSKSYGKTEVIKDLNLEIPSGQRVILLGPSGCGKTTTLRMIAGLEEITGGDLYMGESRVNDVESGDRNVAMVFQNYALFPHMTVYKNIAFGLRTYKLTKAEIQEKVEAIMGVLELKEYKDRLPRQLSGGQRQRVALARAAVKNARYFLLDEPLSNLDAQLRAQARKELVKLHEMNHPTFVYVTHDQIEAMTIGQKVVLMYGGNIQMADTPYNIYHRPINVFTARFIGSPPMNILKVRLTEGKLKIGHDLVELEDDWLALLTRTGKDEFYLGIRPEEVLLSHRDDGNCVQIAVKYAENYGNRLGIYFDIEEAECVASVEIGQGLGSSSQVFWSLKPSKLSFFDVETEKNIGYPEKYQKQENETLLHAEQLLHLQGA
ncbi:MAG TPA: ABC transporter ATP-binding protein [Candidatus Blautia gallistercoris]|uniref:ABC transporter ATP-binding protein n=1 Tax=Candidatus Blautia gallistercoris TaxID=2838490 RepID=A0A9D1WHM9_9FIRM|nr:ABC transporter ATP-binding protein [Candidatus Blautia gallistercoris]